MSKQTVHHATLNNGIILLAECLPGLESVAVAFHTPAGAVHDPSGCSGLATLTGEMMLRGAGDRNGRRIVDDLEGAGIQWSQGVTTSHASFSGGMVAKQLATALPIYADILQHPLLDPKELEKARQVVLQTLAGMEDDPSHRVISALRKLMFPAPWGQPPEGMSADVENLSEKNITFFILRRYNGEQTFQNLSCRHTGTSTARTGRSQAKIVTFVVSGFATMSEASPCDKANLREASAW